MVSLETMTADRDYWRMETVKLQSRLDAALLRVDVRDEQFAALLAEAMRRMCPEKEKCSGACAGSEFGKWAIVELAPSRFAHKPKHDTCEVRMEGRCGYYCSEYQKDSRSHAPTCHFFEKRINEICWCASKAEASGAVCPIHDTEQPKSEIGVFCLQHRKVMHDGVCPKCATKKRKCLVCGGDHQEPCHFV